ncbi:ABC transporter substrate-binding protein [Brachybacterium aquaticum]|uniref:Peptide/nickel transport system substrate-binding protein n=1 Tax=Brachybacterium aquaticum TaxID=1432564 RepID=A0A841AG93_9MICO|nr:ABC transporter substrate-binding protein [Brachybacterium aquaticum]MBB5832300.1 peptide/nickel transport system substrate-binding protein [Brachybacterium aquaticum]
MSTTAATRPSRRRLLQGLGAGAVGLAVGLPLVGGVREVARADGTGDDLELSFLISNLDGGWVPAKSAISSYEANVWQQLTDKLVHTDPKGKVTPWIAESWEQSEDATEYVLHLKDGVTFSDGTPLDADAVIANLQAWAVGRPDEGLPRVGLFPGGTFEGAEALDPLTVRVAFTAPTLSFLPTLGYHGCQLMAPSSLAGSLEEQSDLSTQVGSGPFVLESWAAGDHVRLVRREDYDWAPPALGASGPATLAAITYTVLPDDTLRASAARAHQTDIAYNVNPQVLDSFTQAGFHIEVPRYLGFVHGYSLRTNVAPFDDVRVRQAFTRGIDRAEILRTVFTDAWEPATSWLQAGVPETTDLTELFEYDPELADRLLDEAGWTERNADGFRTKDGTELGFTLYPTPYLTGSVPEAELISQHLRRLGIRVHTQKLDIPTWTERVTNDLSQGVGEVTRSFVDVGTVAGVITDEGEDWFSVGSSDPELVRLRDAVAGAADREERAGLVDELSRHVLEQAYFIPLEQNVQRIYVQSPDLKGITFNAVAIPSYHAATKEPS